MRTHAPLLTASLLLSLSTTALAQTAESSALPPPPPPPLVEAPSAPPAHAATAPTASSAPAVDTHLATAETLVERRMNRLTMGPLTLFTLQGSFEYERAVADKVSIFIGPRFGVVLGYNFGVSAGVRFYPGVGARAPEGGWVGPEIWSEFASIQGFVSNTHYANTTATGMLLAMGGYNWIWPSGWTMSLGGGIGGGVVSRKGTGPTLASLNGAPSSSAVANISGTNLAPALGLQWNVGYAF